MSADKPCSGGLTRWARWLDICLYTLCGALLVVLLCTVAAGIGFRAINQPLGWTDEMSGYLMVWLACLGSMMATRRRTHMRIGLFMDKLPHSAWRANEVLCQCAVAAIGLIAAWQSIHLMRVNHDIQAISLPVSTAWLYAPLLPAGLLAAIQAMVDMCGPRPTPADATESAPWSA